MGSRLTPPSLLGLCEIPDGQLAAIAGAGDKVVERIGHVVQRRHAQPRLHVRERDARLDVGSLASGFCGHVRWQRSERGAQIADQPIVGAFEIDADRGDGEMVREQPGVSLVAGVTVARHDHADHPPRRRDLTETGDNRRVHTAAQAYDEAARARFGRALLEPLRNQLHTCRHIADYSIAGLSRRPPREVRRRRRAGAATFAPQARAGAERGEGPPRATAMGGPAGRSPPVKIGPAIARRPAGRRRRSSDRTDARAGDRFPRSRR